MLLGGDFLGIHEQQDGILSLLIGDVTGRGAAAAGTGAMLRAAWLTSVHAELELQALRACLTNCSPTRPALFRDLGWSTHVLRGAQELALKVQRGQEKLTTDAGRSPTVHELAQHMELIVERVLEGIEAAAAHHADSLETLRDDSDRDSGVLAGTLGFDDAGFTRVKQLPKRCQESISPSRSPRMNRPTPQRCSIYEVLLRFSVDKAKPPDRNALHGSLDAVRSVTVMASSSEQAEAYVDQIRMALEHEADS